MRYITHDDLGNPASGPPSEHGRGKGQPIEGDMEYGSELSVPDGGTISIELSPGRWLTFWASQWGTVKLSDRPTTAVDVLPSSCDP